MLSQITNNSRKTLYRHLMYYTNRICTSHFKEDIFHKCQAIFHCSCIKETKVNLESNKFNRFLDDEKEDKGIKNFNQGHETFDTKIFTSDDSFPLKRYLEKLYPQPLQNLHMIYDIVHKEFNKKCISLTVTVDSPQKGTECTINITWPETVSFSYKGPNKKVASYNAALMCLDWLFKNKRIKGVKPILYTSQDINYLLESQQYINISLESQLKNEIQLLIDVFNNKISSEIVTKVSEDDLKVDVEDSISLDTNSINHINIYNHNMKKHYRQRKIYRDLPILQYKYDILNKLQNNQILLIKGNTGCGKSTQVPQYIIDAHAEESMGSECNILISEPRRVVALSLANTVAIERGEKPGDVVGYHVRFDKVLPQMGRSILYCTQGILLRRLESDPTLKRVTHVIIDEVHERSIQTDLTLKLLKDLLKHNSHIKLIIMSATINTELFKKYFSCEIFEVPGKTYPVNMHFIDDIGIFKRQSLNQNNLLEMGVPFDKIVDLIQWIIRTKPPGAILCFLPGWHEISYLHKLLQSTEMHNLLILPLHSKVTNKNQKAVFDPVPNNITKIILATDIAESGITIVDVSYVIDTAVKREIQWDKNKSLSSVNITRISQTNILQRKGRAGRVKYGESFHLITRKEYNELEKFPKPDILKIPLEQTIIISKIHSKKKAKDFMNEMIEVPDNTVINCAVHNLQKLNILDKDENLTNLGKRVKHMSLTPKLSKAVILSGIFQYVKWERERNVVKRIIRCVDPILSLTCMFSDWINYTVSLDGNHNVLYKDIKLQHHKTSDHIAELKYFQELINNKNSLFYDVPKNSLRNLSSLKQLYALHLDDLFRSGIIPSSLNVEYMNTYSKNNELIRAVLFAATNHLIKRNAYGYEKGYFTKYQNSLYTESNEYVKLKSSSVNYGRRRWPSDILTYLYTMSFVKRKSTLVLDTSIISPLSVLLFSSGDVLCNKMQDDTSANEEIVRLDIENIENLTLCCEKETAHILLTFRSILWKMVEFQLEHASAADHEENLEEVQFFQRKLMALVAKLLHKSSEGIDDMTDDDLKPTES